jgi:hypothetical protein
VSVAFECDRDWIVAGRTTVSGAGVAAAGSPAGFAGAPTAFASTGLALACTGIWALGADPFMRLVAAGWYAECVETTSAEATMENAAQNPAPAARTSAA